MSFLIDKPKLMLSGGDSGGGGTPEPTAEERELARQGVQRYNRYATRYAPLEDEAIDNVDRPTERLNAGRTNADLMQEATENATRSMGQDDVATGVRSLRDLSGALTRSQGANRSAAVTQDRTQRDQRGLSMMETGLGMSGRQVQGLSSMAANANQQAMSELEAEQAERDARTEAVAGVVGTAAGEATSAYQRNKLNSRLESARNQSYAPGDFTSRANLRYR